VGLITGSK